MNVFTVFSFLSHEFLDPSRFALTLAALWLSFLLVAQKVLEVGEVLAVDVSCIAALNTTVNVQIKYNGPVRRAVFGVSRSFLWISLSISIVIFLFTLVFASRSPLFLMTQQTSFFILCLSFNHSNQLVLKASCLM
jgi:hypothetical protein